MSIDHDKLGQRERDLRVTEKSGTPVPTFKTGDRVTRIDPSSGHEYIVLGIVSKGRRTMRVRNLTTGTEFITYMDKYKQLTKLDKVLA